MESILILFLILLGIGFLVLLPTLLILDKRADRNHELKIKELEMRFVKLSPEDFERFCDMLENPPEPNKKLKEIMKK